MERKAHWEAVYQSKSETEVSWYQSSPKRSLDLISRLQLNYTDPVIDVGAGASRLVDNLLSLGYEDITVLDISRTAIEMTQSRLGNASGFINWVESDVTQYSPKQGVRLWHDRAVFHFLTERTDRQAYINSLKQCLVPEGHLIIAAFSPAGPNKCSGLEIVQYDEDKICKELGSEFKLIETVSEPHQTPFNSQQHFNYFLLRRSNSSLV